tara:strand:- start:464 stop:748 length:285 start_codon:yes stop_codon:yes gene_type:complete
MGEKKDRFKVWRVRKEKQKPQFPKHWGDPPKIQTRDYRKLPGDYGYGSSTLATWITENLKKDKEKPKKPNLPDRYKDGSWHLLLLKNPSPFTQA